MTCARCGHENPKHFLTCGQCGEVLATKKAPPPEPEPAPGTTGSHYDNMIVDERATVSVTLPAHGRFMMPDACACCLRPSLTRGSMMATRTEGNTTYTFTLEYPLCSDCDTHIRRNTMAAGAGVLCAIGATIGALVLLNKKGALSWTSGIIGVVVSIALGVGIAALYKRLKPPPTTPDCVDSVEPIKLVGYDREYVTVVCLNRHFGELLRKANFG
jgi:hypothetical protein